MDLLGGYCDEDENNNEIDDLDTDLVPKMTINPNPNVHIEKANNQIDHNTSIVFYNPKYTDIISTELGPTKPFAPKKSETGKNLKTGNIEAHYMNDFSFETRLNLIQKHFYSENGNKKRVREKEVNDDPLEYKGPWAQFKIEGEEEVVKTTLTDEEIEKLREDSSTIKKLKQQEHIEKELEKDIIEETTVFHGEEFKDYLGRTYITPPSELKPKEHDCYAPKKAVYTWSHHTGAVNSVKFFPIYGHLLLSCSMDKTVKIYSTLGKKDLLRTYLGHKGGVRDVNFNGDGKKFISTSYDKCLRVWDTETGQIIQTLGNNELHYTAKFSPINENEFLTGCRDHKIYQFDIREKKEVQEYNTHLQAVNTITYIEDGKRFVSTSDDKTIKIWEYGLPVEIKYVSDPTMHAMPAAAISLDGKWFAGQSLDNQIIVYYARERFRVNRKKIFKGHLVAGYACQPSFSVDNKYVISGESSGKLCIWDWKSTKIVRKLDAHEGVCISTDWHPIETSKVATCGWDGKVKLFD